MITVDQTLMRAARACDYVQNMVRLRIPNLDEGINKDLSQHDYILKKGRQARQDLAALFFNQKALRRASKQPDLTLVDCSAYRAKQAIETRVGRCEEAVALAFQYLKCRGERGMAAMKIIGIDHVFIVMGFEKPPPFESYSMMNFGPPIEWGKNTVFCDPWYFEWFANDVDWMRKIRQIVRYATRDTYGLREKIRGLDMRDNADLWLRVRYSI